MRQGDPQERDTSRDAARCTAGIRRGDRDAFLLLYERQFEKVLAMARTITQRDESFCLDVVQEAFVRVIVGLPRLEDWAAVEAWMARATRSAAIDLLRRELRDVRRRLRRGAPEIQGRAVDEERVAWIGQRLADLDAQTERLLRAHVVDGRTLADLAGAGASRDAVHGKIRRALAGLRRAAMEAFRDE